MNKSEKITGAHLPQEIIDERTFVNMIGCALSAKHDLDGVRVAERASPKGLETEEAGGRMGIVGEGSRGGVD